MQSTREKMVQLRARPRRPLDVEMLELRTFDERLLTLKELSQSRLFGSKISVHTLTRWATRGVRGIDGRRVKLPVLIRGGPMATTESAVISFLEELTSGQKPPTAAQAARQQEEAEQRCEEIGI